MVIPPQQYESGMRIAYDSASLKVTVTFRGRITTIDGTYVSQTDAIAAGELYCRKLGWVPDAKTRSASSIMRRR